MFTRIKILVFPLLRLSHRGYRYGDHWDSMYDMVVKGWDHVLDDMAAWFQEEY